MKAPGLQGFRDTINSSGGRIPLGVVDEKFKLGFDYVLSQVTYVKKRNYLAWKITTWTKMIQRNKIEQFGTQEDKERLPPPTCHNRPHAHKQVRTH